MLSTLQPLIWALLLGTASAAPDPSKGCEQAVKTSLKPGGPSSSFTFESNAGDGTLMRRRVRIHLPESYVSGKPSPVMVVYHGKYRNGTAFEQISGFSSSEVNKDTIVVYPDGIDVGLLPRLELNWSSNMFYSFVGQVTLTLLSSARIMM